ncbi:MAG: transposase [Rhodobacteraceae bacterium]|nr:transposase [Paracoccaceae bacterium]
MTFWKRCIRSRRDTVRCRGHARTGAERYYRTDPKLSGIPVGEPIQREVRWDRREALNAEWFTATEQARIVIARWPERYNRTRPRQALDMPPPVPETLLEKHQIGDP